MGRIHDTVRWKRVAARAKARDGHRCSVARLLGGACHGALHAHHVVPVSEGGAPFDLDNVLTICASHHPQLEALRRAIVHRRETARPQWRRCPHTHRSREARELCERRLNRASSVA